MIWEAVVIYTIDSQYVFTVKTATCLQHSPAVLCAYMYSVDHADARFNILAFYMRTKPV